MPFKILKSTLVIFCLMSCAVPCVVLCADQSLVNLGRWSKAELAQIIAAAHRIDAPGDRIAALSQHFIDTPYVAETLIGDPQTAEQLVINLAGFDCFTLLDVVEALRRAADVDDFPEQMQQVRYRDGKVAYENRRHFFSDWVAGDAVVIGDVTAGVGQGGAQVVVKQLNRKSDDTYWMPEISVTRREMTYIPTHKIDRDVLSALQVGDYVGIYSDQAGLDVSHTGLIVKDKDRVMLRHASSRSSVRRVVDEDLLDYLQGKPGLVVYRVRTVST
jgi:hypothetical protein